MQEAAQPQRRTPRILLLLTRKTYRAEAFLAAAARLGVDVVVGTNHRASLQDLVPERNLTVDFDDPEGSTLSIVQASRELPIDSIIAAEDEGTLVAATASKALGLAFASESAVRIARDKAALRRCMAGAGLPVPSFVVVEPDELPASAARRVPFPCVVKPLSLSASRGVIRADDPVQLHRAIEDARRIVRKVRPGVDPTLLIEAFLPGREAALEGVLVDGRLQTFAILDKPDPLDGPYFEETMLITPSSLTEEVQRSVQTLVQAVAGAMELRDGPVHAELRIDGGRIRLLELAARSIGGRCSRMLRFEDGATLEEIILRYALGSPSPTPRLAPGASGVMMLPIPEAGVLRGVEGQARAKLVPFIEALELTAPLGTEVRPPPEGSTYLGFLFARAESPKQVDIALRKAHNYIQIEIEAAEKVT